MLTIISGVWFVAVKVSAAESNYIATEKRVDGLKEEIFDLRHEFKIEMRFIRKALMDLND